jgi:hypothetical protein
VLEKLYGIDLPDFSDELEQWSNETGFKNFLEPRQLQMALITLGYDLGPHGADGAIGKKTRAALLLFEQQNANIPEEHKDGMIDRFTAPALEDALEQRGIELLS